ncbi:conserved hypothetical protein [Beggiatoa sp. PS]|nr:conserved hypothetical protein [Beggiatoa sp. PS]
MFEIIAWLVGTLVTIISFLAATDHLCSGCIKKWSLVAYFRRQRFKRNQEPMMEPSGTMPLNSPFYVERPPIESDCYENIAHPNALIRIKAPRQMGKSSLLVRILAHAEQQEYRTVNLSFQEADSDIFSSLDRFLYWFCGSVTEQLNLPDKLSENWQGVLGSKSKCSNYFENSYCLKSPSLWFWAWMKWIGFSSIKPSPLIFLHCYEHGMKRVKMMNFGKCYAWSLRILKKSMCPSKWINRRLMLALLLSCPNLRQNKCGI